MMDDAVFKELNKQIVDATERNMGLGCPVVKMGGIYYPLKVENGVVIRDKSGVHTQKHAIDILLNDCKRDCNRKHEREVLKDYLKRTE